MTQRPYNDALDRRNGQKCLAWACHFAVVAALLFSSGTQADEVLRFGSHLPARSTGGVHVVTPWLAAVRKEQEAALQILEYWGGTLGKHPDKQMELVQSGILDIGWVLPAYSGGQFPELGLFELPYLFESAQEASAVAWHLYSEGRLSGFDGVRLIGVFTTAPNGLFLRQSAESIEALVGLKIRSLGATHNAWLEQFGAAAQTLSPVDMNQALDRGLLDGAIQGWTGMRTFDSFALVKEAWQVPLGTTVFLLLINESSWQSLSVSAQRALLKHGGLNIAALGGQGYAQVGTDIRAGLIAEGGLTLKTPSAEQSARYQRRSLVVHRDWVEKTENGQAVYQRALQLRDAWRAANRDE